MVYYLLDGRRHLADNINSSVLALYADLLNRDQDLTDVRYQLQSLQFVFKSSIRRN